MINQLPIAVTCSSTIPNKWTIIQNNSYEHADIEGIFPINTNFSKRLNLTHIHPSSM
ncbi:MAG: hypothetical protein ACP5N1_04060 [Candidatus Woesearchaeota archaeon]